MGLLQAEPAKLERIVAGVAEGCVQAGCALVGGETAEMPGMYPDGEYDIAGFAVGVVEKEALIDGRTIEAGDIVLGLASSGVHSNGFSLVRHIVESQGLAYTDEIAMLDTTLGNALLLPTRIYSEAAKAAIATGRVQGMAHITGGGFYENVPRMLPEGLGVTFDASNWPSLPVFDWLEQVGHVSKQEMFNVFNMGIGFMITVRPEDVEVVEAALERAGETSHRIGKVDAKPGVRIMGVDQ